MTVSCPSSLCISASLPLVTSQARLESDVLDPQPGVTAGFHRMFEALGQARLESDVLDPQPGVTAGTRRMFQALGSPDRSPAVPSVSR